MICIWLLFIIIASPNDCIKNIVVDCSSLSLDLKRVHLARVNGVKGNGVTANSKLTADQIIFSIPSNACIFALRNGEIFGLCGQTDLMWEAVGDLRESVADEDYARGRTWDVQLSLAILEATAGTALGGELWDAHTSNLPSPIAITVPFCMSDDLVDLIKLPDLRNAIKLQKQRLKELFPSLQDRRCHRVTNHFLQLGENSGKNYHIPSPLEWSFALVRSRCFQATKDSFAMVPVLDMINHNSDPNARYEWVNDRKEFQLTANRNILEGEEITISYSQSGNGLSNDRLLLQYGFCSPANPHDCLWSFTPWEAKEGRAGALKRGGDSVRDGAGSLTAEIETAADSTLFRLVEKNECGGEEFERQKTRIATVKRSLQDWASLPPLSPSDDHSSRGSERDDNWRLRELLDAVGMIRDQIQESLLVLADRASRTGDATAPANPRHLAVLQEYFSEKLLLVDLASDILQNM